MTIELDADWTVNTINGLDINASRLLVRQSAQLITILLMFDKQRLANESRVSGSANGQKRGPLTVLNVIHE